MKMNLLVMELVLYDIVGMLGVVVDVLYVNMVV